MELSVSKMKLVWTCAVLMLAVSAAAAAGQITERSIQLPDDNAMATLKPGSGVEVARANCVICHSTDYIVRQPGSDAKHWDAEVRKMVTVFGAPISDSDAKVIADYLSTAYGPQVKTEPAPPERTPAPPRKSKSEKP